MHFEFSIAACRFTMEQPPRHVLTGHFTLRLGDKRGRVLAVGPSSGSVIHFARQYAKAPQLFEEVGVLFLDGNGSIYTAAGRPGRTA